jgi:replication factor C large subunit
MNLDFQPKKLDQIVGNKASVSRIKQWYLGFLVGKKQKPLLIYGPPGCAKSATIYALANEQQANLILIQPPSETEDLDKWGKSILELSEGTNLFGTLNLLVFENIDSWGEEKAKKAITKIIGILKSQKTPIILTANDPYNKHIYQLKNLCEQVQFKALTEHDIFLVLEDLSKKLNINLNKQELLAIAKNSAGDLRAAINDLRAKNPSSFREKQKNQFELLRSIFKINSYMAAMQLSFLIGPVTERDFLKLFIAENLELEFKDKSQLAKAYDYLSKSDIFDGRIYRTQYWGYLRYSTALLLAGVPLSKNTFSYFVPYKFPAYLQKLSYSKSTRDLKKSIFKKIALKLHTTTKKASSYLDLIVFQIAQEKNNINKIISFYDFDEQEVLFLEGLIPILAKKPKK